MFEGFYISQFTGGCSIHFQFQWLVRFCISKQQQKNRSISCKTYVINTHSVVCLINGLTGSHLVSVLLNKQETRSGSCHTFEHTKYKHKMMQYVDLDHVLVQMALSHQPFPTRYSILDHEIKASHLHQEKMLSILALTF